VQDGRKKEPEQRPPKEYHVPVLLYQRVGRSTEKKALEGNGGPEVQVMNHCIC